jgi:hypothetical protein
LRVLGGIDEATMFTGHPVTDCAPPPPPKHCSARSTFRAQFLDPLRGDDLWAVRGQRNASRASKIALSPGRAVQICHRADGSPGALRTLSRTSARWPSGSRSGTKAACGRGASGRLLLLDRLDQSARSRCSWSHRQRLQMPTSRALRHVGPSITARVAQAPTAMPYEDAVVPGRPPRGSASTAEAGCPIGGRLQALLGWNSPARQLCSRVALAGNLNVSVMAEDAAELLDAPPTRGGAGHRPARPRSTATL